MKRVLLLSLAGATAVKLYLAAFTNGSFDVVAYQDQLRMIHDFGAGVYRQLSIYGNPFNHPPPMIHVIELWGWLSSSGIPFGFWFRFTSTLADVGSFFLVWRLLKALNRENSPALFALAICPASILISGFHGNTDSLMILFLLLSICFTTKESHWGGVFFGCALSVKLVPLIFGPAFFFFLPWRKRFEFFALAGALFFAFSLPYVLEDPSGILRGVFAYSSLYGKWGLTLIAYLTFSERPVFLHSGYEVLGIHALFAQFLKYLTLTLAMFIAFRLRRESLFIQCGFIAALLLSLTPGFGVQYLLWLVPFVTILPLRTELIYYAMTGVYLFIVYFCYAEKYCPNPIILSLLSLTCWLGVLWVLLEFVRLTKSGNRTNSVNIRQASPVTERN